LLDLIPTLKTLRLLSSPQNDILVSLLVEVNDLGKGILRKSYKKTGVYAMIIIFDCLFVVVGENGLKVMITYRYMHF
jgi:hypothetical protein